MITITKLLGVYTINKKCCGPIWSVLVQKFFGDINQEHVFSTRTYNICKLI